MFLYFLPNATTQHLKPELLARLGLDVALREFCTPQGIGRLTTREVSHGPEGLQGVIVCAEPPGLNITVGYFPAEQAWSRCGVDQAAPGKCLYHLGIDRRFPPTPETLQRPSQTAGEELQLGDGQVWLVPTIRRWPQGTNLTRQWGVDESGQFASRVRDDLQWAWELAGKIWDALLGRSDATTVQVFEWAVAVLGLNYRVGPHEVSRLNLFDSENCGAVCRTAIDATAIQNFERSQEPQAILADAAQPATSSISPGPPAACQTTAPATENSTC